MSSTDNIPRICSQLFLPAELAEKAVETAHEINPDNLIRSPAMIVPPAGGIVPAQGMRPPGFRGSSVVVGGPRMGLFFRKMWDNGRTLNVRFLSGGSHYVREQIKKYANKWSDHANIKFNFVESGPADIRICIKPGGSNSYVGTDARQVDANKATMNYGWFSDDTAEDIFRATTMHEFGHAIGCIHEHSQPNAQIQWNKPYVYGYYARENGWSKEDVDFNVLDRYTWKDVKSTVFDPSSIMEYPILAELTTNNFTIGWNSRLSKKDIEFIGIMYPMTTTTSTSTSTSTAPSSDLDLETGNLNTMANPFVKATAMDKQTVISFSNPYPSEPGFTVGLNFLDFQNSRKIWIKPEISACMPTQAIINLKAWDGTTNPDLGVSWFLFPVEDRNFQHGSCEFSTKLGWEKTIAFDPGYLSPPQVVVFFTALSFNKPIKCCIETYASGLTTHSFKLNVRATSDTWLSDCKVSWVALPANMKGITAGTFGTQDIESRVAPQPNNHNTVAFEPRFTRPPRIFLALNMLDVRGTNTRVRLSNSELSGSQMTWCIDSWGEGTDLYAAAGAYIAIDT